MINYLRARAGYIKHLIKLDDLKSIEDMLIEFGKECYNEGIEDATHDMRTYNVVGDEQPNSIKDVFVMRHYHAKLTGEDLKYYVDVARILDKRLEYDKSIKI